MTISRNTFDPTKNYKLVQYHQDRDLLDSELNEQQQISKHEQRKVTDMLLQEGAIVSGLDVTISGNTLTIAEGVVYVDGSLETVPDAILAYNDSSPPEPQYVYVELLKFNYGKSQDADLINPATGEATAEREKWIVALKAEDTTSDALPEYCTERKVVPVYRVNLDVGDVRAVISSKTKLRLDDLGGSLLGDKVAVSSITENQLVLPAAEGLNSLLQNLAERTHDQSGSFVVNGLDSFINRIDEASFEVITNPGRAYVQGYRLHKEFPTALTVPISIASKSVKGENEQYFPQSRRLPVKYPPLKESTTVEIMVIVTEDITRGSIIGGTDLLIPNPVVDILQVKQGDTDYEEDVDWKESGNYIDWSLEGDEPAAGSTYSVRWAATVQLVKGVDYTDSGWFGIPGYPEAGTYFYFVTGVTASGETSYLPSKVISRYTEAGDINAISWNPIADVTSYRIYRGAQGVNPTDLDLLKEVESDVTSYTDDGADEILDGHPPTSGPVNMDLYPLAAALGNLDVINIKGSGDVTSPVPGSFVAYDYESYLGRRDVIYATKNSIQRIAGAPAAVPQLPTIPEGALALCSIDCPPNSVDVKLVNFGLTRVPMDRLHRLIQEVEQLNQKIDLMAMREQLQIGQLENTKGLYSDNFETETQSDLDHPDFNARIDTFEGVVSLARSRESHLLEVDHSKSHARFAGSQAMLPATENILIVQSDWSEDRTLNPNNAFGKPEASIWITPNSGRAGETTFDMVGFHFQPSVPFGISCEGDYLAEDTTDSAGRISTSFIVPEEMRIGDCMVEVTDGVTTAQCKIRIDDPLSLVHGEQNEKPFWNQQSRSLRLAPLAQIFGFAQDQIISSVGIQFTQKDDALPVTVQIRTVTNGLPSNQVLAEAVLAPGEISLGSESKVSFSESIYAQADNNYALVLLTESSDYRVRTATVGQVGQSGFITHRPDNAGVLLESVDAVSWSALENSFLNMAIYGYEFEPSGLIRFQPVANTEIASFVLDVATFQPVNTSIRWEYSTDDGESWNSFVHGVDEDFSNVMEHVIVRALLTGEQSSNSPVINFRDAVLLGYRNQEQSVYITKAVEFSDYVGSVEIFVQLNISSGTGMNWYASNDDGATWKIVVMRESGQIDNWTKYEGVTAFTETLGKKVRFKVELHGNEIVSPQVKSLAAVIR